MGRLRDRRRGGGPSRTIQGLTRTGTASKVVGNRQIQNPVVNDVTVGEIIQTTTNATPQRIKTTPIRARATACMLLGVDWENGGPYPDPATDNADTGQFGFVKVGDNVLTWANAQCTFTFWVF